MNWFDKWFAKKCKQAWENKNRFDRDELVGAKQMSISTGMVERSRPEGENRINFELSSAVGGKILNVRHYDERKDRHETQTYVIPSGEDIGERVAKIVNLEMFKL
jgi:hypothetical protein